MRLISVLSLCLASALCLPAFAAERGVYRPGKPYQAVAANSADICQSQCQGDAQCRSWNFVRLRQGHSVGICEFLDKAAAPIASPVSISGVSASASHGESHMMSARMMSARMVSGGTNTVRIGDPAASVMPPSQPVQSRQIVRRAIPDSAPTSAPSPVRPASYKRQMRRLAGPNSVSSPVSRPRPNPAPSVPRPPVVSPIAAPSAAMQVTEAPRPLFRPYLDGQQQVTGQPQKQQPPKQQAQNQPVKPSHASKAVANTAQIPAVIGGSSVPSLMPPALNALPSNVSPDTISERQISSRAALAGRAFYDEVNSGPVATPKVLVPQDIPNDPDAPIATVSAVPVIPVDVEPF